MGRRVQRLVSSVNDWIAKFNAQRIDDMMIEALWVDGTPIYTLEQASVIIGAMDANMNMIQIVNAAGEITESRSGSINTLSTNIREILQSSNPLAWTAAGLATNIAAAENWVPILPVTVVAGGAGAPPATVFVALNAGDLIDVMIYMDNDIVAGANQYVHRFRTDPLAAVGGIAAVDPAWDIVIPVPANGSTPRSNPYGHRMITTAAANAFGIADGAAGDWPNNAQVTFTGFYRYI